MPVWSNVLKSVCSKKKCFVDGEKPVMLLLAQATPKSGASSRKNLFLCLYELQDSESEDDLKGRVDHV